MILYATSNASGLLRLVLLAGALLILGCSGGHTLDVRLRTDWNPGVDYTLVRAVLSNDSGAGRRELSVGGFSGDQARALAGMPVAEFSDLAPGRWDLLVELVGADGEVLSARPVEVDLSRDLGVTVVITRSCRDVGCGASEACQGGACVDLRCSPESPEYCGQPQCSRDSDCPAATQSCGGPVCRDGSCLFTPTAMACEENEVCDPDRGCVAFRISVDGGLRSDAGPFADSGTRDGGTLSDGGASDAGPRQMSETFDIRHVQIAPTTERASASLTPEVMEGFELEFSTREPSERWLILLNISSIWTDGTNVNGVVTLEVDGAPLSSAIFGSGAEDATERMPLALFGGIDLTPGVHHVRALWRTSSAVHQIHLGMEFPHLLAAQRLPDDALIAQAATPPRVQSAGRSTTSVTAVGDLTAVQGLTRPEGGEVELNVEEPGDYLVLASIGDTWSDSLRARVAAPSAVLVARPGLLYSEVEVYKIHHATTAGQRLPISMAGVMSLGVGTYPLSIRINRFGSDDFYVGGAAPVWLIAYRLPSHALSLTEVNQDLSTTTYDAFGTPSISHAEARDWLTIVDFSSMREWFNDPMDVRLRLQVGGALAAGARTQLQASDSRRGMLLFAVSSLGGGAWPLSVSLDHMGTSGGGTRIDVDQERRLVSY